MRAGSLLGRPRPAVLEFPELGVFHEHVKGPYRGDHPTPEAVLPAPSEEKHRAETRQGMHHERANPHPGCPTLMPATRHNRRIGIDLAEMLRNIPVAAVPHLDIEVLHTALDVHPLVKDVPTPLAPLPIKEPEFVLRPPPAM